jgi:Cu/Ag efflux pump CusA
MITIPSQKFIMALSLQQLLSRLIRNREMTFLILGELPIMNAQNQIIKLSEIADISQKNGRSKILHQNGKRVQTVTANIG